MVEGGGGMRGVDFEVDGWSVWGLCVVSKDVDSGFYDTIYALALVVVVMRTCNFFVFGLSTRLFFFSTGLLKEKPCT